MPEGTTEADVEPRIDLNCTVFNEGDDGEGLQIDASLNAAGEDCEPGELIENEDGTRTIRITAASVREANGVSVLDADVAALKLSEARTRAHDAEKRFAELEVVHGAASEYAQAADKRVALLETQLKASDDQVTALEEAADAGSDALPATKAEGCKKIARIMDALNIRLVNFGRVRGDTMAADHVLEVAKHYEDKSE